MSKLDIVIVINHLLIAELNHLCFCFSLVCCDSFILANNRGNLYHSSMAFTCTNKKQLSQGTTALSQNYVILTNAVSLNPFGLVKGQFRKQKIMDRQRCR